MGNGRASLFCDSRGVFVLEAPSGAPWRIYGKTQSTWSPVYQATDILNYATLSGFDGGPLVEYHLDSGRIDFISGGSKTCSGAFAAVHVFIVDARSAYALSDNRLYVYDGAYWKEQTGPLGPADYMATAVWAKGDAVVVLSSSLLFVHQGRATADAQVALPDIGANVLWGSPRTTSGSVASSGGLPTTTGIHGRRLKRTPPPAGPSRVSGAVRERCSRIPIPK
jgi:hypothetical protein